MLRKSFSSILGLTSAPERFNHSRNTELASLKESMTDRCKGVVRAVNADGGLNINAAVSRPTEVAGMWVRLVAHAMRAMDAEQRLHAGDMYV